ncbi:MAG: cyclopropane-fatty-acyl-phospholipid synthase [Thermoplasmata archaeon]|jgi:cyclopropane-fatty-acyl-phospholipid synthase|nr:cyclopropane-fatty-acyl-phospholipid synthase [Thermoplasmata archaeon]
MAIAGLAKRQVTAMLETAGVEVGGSRPHDIQVHDERTYRRMALEGTLGIGESYMDGWWDCERVDEMAARVLAAAPGGKIRPAWPSLVLGAKARLMNLQKPSRAFHVGQRHYDIGNDLYERMLDPRMAYSCGYWRTATDLAAAQEAKLDLVCRKLGLEAGMTLLDIGCGWGSLAAYAAERYGVRVTGLTVSVEQAKLARERCKGLDVDIVVSDYRAWAGRPERFDRVASVGMLEHVGHKNYRSCMEVAHHLLADGGLMLLHTIGTIRSEVSTDPWTHRYIFPNGMVPSLPQLGAACDRLFLLEDLHGFGQDYDPTLLAWHANLAGWDEMEERYGERFWRMWSYYLLTAAASFRARRLQLWQLVLAKDRGVPGGYIPVR